MKRASTQQFYLAYFRATQNASRLFRLNTNQRLKMLEELMQWEVTIPVSKP